METGAEWILEHVDERVLEVLIAIEDPSGEPTLEEMADPVVPSVESHCVQPVQALHPARELRLRGSDNQMEVVRHQRPREYLPAEARCDVTELAFPPIAVERVADDRAPGYTARRDVVHGGRRQVGASSSRHL